MSSSPHVSIDRIEKTLSFMEFMSTDQGNIKVHTISAFDEIFFTRHIN